MHRAFCRIRLGFGKKPVFFKNMNIKSFLLFLWVLCAAIGVQAQASLQNIKFVNYPLIDENTPDWAKLMYSEAPNVFEVDRLYRAYYQSHTFEKNRDTRNYKHWRKALERNNYVLRSGFIAAQTDEERDLATQEWLAQKALLDAQLTANKSTVSATWQQIGPYENRNQNNTHRSAHTCQTRIAQCAAFPDILYTVSENGIFFKTTNHGDSWSPISENYYFEGYTTIEMALAVHPTNPDIVYYGTDNKLWKTTDGGVTWTNILTVMDLDPTAFAIHPTNPNIIYLSAGPGIYKTTDGTNFSIIRAGKAWDLKMKTDDPTTLFAICKNGNKSDFYKSTDSGATWSASISGWFANAQDYDGGGRMTVSTGNPNLIYCFILGRVTGDNVANPFVGVAKSTDAGATWSQPVTWNNRKGMQVHYDFRVCSIEVSDANDNLVLCGNLDSYRTTDGFATVMTNPVSGQHEDQQQYMFNGPNDFWVTSDGGIDLYNSTLTSRSSKARGVAGTDFWYFDQGWNEDTRAGSYYHNGASGYREGYPNNEFLGFGSGEPSAAYISVLNPAKMWFEGIIDGRSLPSTITGQMDEFFYGKYPNDGVGNYERSELVIHPQYLNTHLLGRDNVLWKTTDGGNSFTAVYTFGSSAANIVTDIEISRANPNVMLVGQLIKSGSSYTSGKLWKTTDGGLTFTEIAQPANAPTADGIFIAMDPLNVDNIWIAYNRTNSNYKVFKSTDGGASWTNLTTSLLNGLLPMALMHVGGTDGGIYLAVKHTVFYRNNSHSDWQPANMGLPARIGNRYLRPFYKAGQIRMATGDRGLWSSDFYETPTTFVPQASVDKKTAYCPRDTFYFEDYSMVNHTGASWSWDFPGATWTGSTTVRNPKVIYGTPGTYTATMTLTTPLGTKNSSVTITVLAGCAPDTIRGQALRTASNSDFFVVSEPRSGNLTHFTVTGWIKPNGTQTGMVGMLTNGQWCGHCSNAEGLIFDNAGTKLWYRWPGNENIWYGGISGLTIPSNEWSYVALVITPTGATLYLNDKKYVDNRTLNPGNFEQIAIGRGFYSQSYKGDIDEVTMWRRALTDDEIRRLRHITREDIIASDPALMAYYQFNATNDIALVSDNVSTRHGSLYGGATLVASTAPIGGGVAQLLPLSSGQYTYNFADPGTNITLSDCDVPSGMLVATRLNVKPNLNPAVNTTPNNQWFINYYGSATSFAPIESIDLKATDGTFVTGLSAASSAIVHTRPVNSDAANWLPRAKGLTLSGNTLSYNRKVNITGDIQIGMTNMAPAFVEVDPGSPCGLNDGPKKTARLNNGSNYIVTAAPVDLGTTNTVTLSAWVKPNGAQSSYTALIMSNAGSGSGLNLETGNQLGYHWNGSFWGWNNGPVLPADVWSHVALVIEPNKATIYLNGVPTPRTGVTHPAVNFSTVFYLGNDRGNTGRTLNGQMDEVRLYNRALTQSEIRELRHLTYPSYAAVDPSLKSYYKFNEESGLVYDRVGAANAIMQGTATRESETGPFEKGASERQSVTTGGNYNFSTVQMSLTFPGSGTYPGGELCVSRIDSMPIAVPANYELVANRYWVVNNYGTNATFSGVTSLTFSGIPVNSTVPERYKLYKRISNGYQTSEWVYVDQADAVTTGTSGSITFSTGLTLTNFSQFIVVRNGVRVSPKVYLQSAYNTGTGLMNDALRVNNLIPTNEPYAALSFPVVQGGGETLRPSALTPTDQNAIVDWVFIELRSKTNAATRLYTRAGLLQRDGDVVDMDGVSPLHFYNAVADDYYVAVRHRNHLGVRSAATVALTETAASVDFTGSLTALYKPVGHPNEVAFVQPDGKVSLWGGNTNGDGVIKMTGPFVTNNDYLKLLNVLGASTNVLSGVYLQQDLNMDGTLKMTGPFVTNNDYLRLLNILGASTNIIQQGY